MLIKAGVSICKLKRPIRRALNTIARVYDSFGEELVITSTFEGNHSPSSLHYAHLAIDCRLLKFNQGQNKSLVRKLKKELGKDYDIILEGTHIHIEYDPKE